MPDNGDASLDRTTVAAAERLARVEARVDNLKEDTGTIRNYIHGINNEITIVRGEMIKFVGLEQQCVDALGAIKQAMTDRSAQIERMASDIASLLMAKNQAEGAWAATLRICSTIVAMIGVLGLLASGFAYLILHWKQ